MSVVLRAALYPRVSTEEQKKFGLSIHDQQNDLEEYAKAHNMKVVGVFQDAGFSARKKIEKRPAMLQLLEAVKRDEVDIILVTKLDRWFRNIGEYYKVQEILEAHNVSWKTIYEDYDTSTATGRLKINIMLAVAQDEADRASERIKKVLDAKKDRNEVCTGNLPKGYKKEGKFAVIDKGAEPIMRRFFSTFLETGAITKAMDAVPELNLNYKTASAILNNTAYMGKWNGLTLPPYLTQQEFQRVQELRRRVTRKSPYNRIYLFSGLTVCGECGRRMTGHPTTLKDGTCVYKYLCQGAKQRRGCDNGLVVREQDIENYFMSSIDEQIQIKLKAKAQHAPKINTDAQIKAIQKKLAKLSELYIDDMISKPDYSKKYAELTEQVEALKQTQVQSRAPEEVADLFAPGWQDIYKNLTRENKRAFWKLKIKEIRLYKDSRIEFDFL